MKNQEAIKDRNDNKPTPYYPAGKTIIISGLGEFPSSLKLYYRTSGESKTYKLCAITADFVYYINVEAEDDTTNTLMLNRNMQLISDNFFGANDLIELVISNDGFLWISRTVKNWQREENIRPHCLIPAIKKALNLVDTEKLTNEEKAIYLAFLNNGPVKYTKAESLMAVLTNSDYSTDNSDQLKAVLNTLKLTCSSFQ